MRWSVFDADAQQILLAARRRAMASGKAISSSHLMAACLVDPSVVEVLGRAGIDHREVSDRLGERPVQTRSELLAAIGVDLAAVLEMLPAAGVVRWQLRRWSTRPLRITLETSSSSARFAASGRKVLEVALWNARHHRRTCSALDLFRGVLADGRDPARACLADDERSMRRLFVKLLELDESRV